MEDIAFYYMFATLMVIFLFETGLLGFIYKIAMKLVIFLVFGTKVSTRNHTGAIALSIKEKGSKKWLTKE